MLPRFAEAKCRHLYMLSCTSLAKTGLVVPDQGLPPVPLQKSAKVSRPEAFTGEGQFGVAVSAVGSTHSIHPSHPIIGEDLE